MNQTVRFGLILGAICLVATLVLAVTYEVTKPRIEEQARLEQERALKEVMPEADSFEAKTAGDVEYFDAYQDSRLIGYCLKVTGNGYGGYIRMIVGIDPHGYIEGVRVLEHTETPGLGSKIADKKPGESESPFLEQFNGKDGTTVEVRKDIDAITGATISSAAVTDAIRRTVDVFMAEVGA